MKGLLAAVLLALAPIAQAGTLTITTTSAQDARIAAAYGHALGLVDGNGNPRPATGPEVKAEIIQQLVRFVRHQEQHMAEQTAAAEERAKADPVNPQ